MPLPVTRRLRPGRRLRLGRRWNTAVAVGVTAAAGLVLVAVALPVDSCGDEDSMFESDFVFMKDLRKMCGVALRLLEPEWKGAMVEETMLSALWAMGKDGLSLYIRHEYLHEDLQVVDYI